MDDVGGGGGTLKSERSSFPFLAIINLIDLFPFSLPLMEKMNETFWLTIDINL